VISLTILLLLTSCGTSKRKTEIERSFNVDYMRSDSINIRVDGKSIEELISKTKLTALINIKHYSVPDSAGVQYVESETNITLTGENDTEKKKEEVIDVETSAVAVEQKNEAGSESIVETKEKDTRLFQVPAWGVVVGLVLIIVVVIILVVKKIV
jgi:hypothetical protein